MKPAEGATELGSAVLSRSRSTKAAAGRGRRSVSRRSISRRSPSPPPPVSPIDARQLSPGMGDYGMDDSHMDGTDGYEEYQCGPDPMEMPDFGIGPSIGYSLLGLVHRSVTFGFQSRVHGSMLQLASTYCDRDIE